MLTHSCCWLQEERLRRVREQLETASTAVVDTTNEAAAVARGQGHTFWWTTRVGLVERAEEALSTLKLKEEHLLTLLGGMPGPSWRKSQRATSPF